MRSPSGVKRGMRKHESPPVGLRQDEERVAHRRRAEPLVAGELVLGAGAAAVQRRRDGGVGADVGAALLLGHRHAAERALLVGRGHEPLAVVGERGEARLPLGGQLGLLAQRRDRPSRSSRSGSRRPASTCEQEHELRGARDVGARARLAPGRGVEAVRDRRAASARATRGGTRPRRCGCRSGRGCGAAAGSRSPERPSDHVGARPQIAPSSLAASLAPTRRPRAERLDQRRGRARRRCSPSSGGGWLSTSWVVARGRSSSLDTGELLSGNRAYTEVSQ